MAGLQNINRTNTDLLSIGKMQKYFGKISSHYANISFQENAVESVVY